MRSDEQDCWHSKGGMGERFWIIRGWEWRRQMCRWLLHVKGRGGVGSGGGVRSVDVLISTYFFRSNDSN